MWIVDIENLQKIHRESLSDKTLLKIMNKRRSNFLRFSNSFRRSGRDFYVRTLRNSQEKDMQNSHSNYSLRRWTSEVQTAVKLRPFNYSHACAFKSPLPAALLSASGKFRFASPVGANAFTVNVVGWRGEREYRLKHH